MLRPCVRKFGQEVRLRNESDSRWAEPISADGMLPVSAGNENHARRARKRLCLVRECSGNLTQHRCSSETGASA